MRMSVGRRVSEAIGSWLHFEFCCHRAGLFSENSLKAAVGQVLSAFPSVVKGARVYADFPHDALNPVRKQGRKREVDFALILAGKGIPRTGAQVLLEIKWTESTHCTAESVFSDFLRLAVLKDCDPNATCIFVLAGTDKNLGKMLRGMPFSSGAGKSVGIGKNQAQRRLTFSKDHAAHVKFFSKGIRQFLSDGFKIPESIVTRSCGLHPKQTDDGTVGFQAMAWEVLSVSSKKLDSNW